MSILRLRHLGIFQPYRELAEHPGVSIVTGDMWSCKKGMRAEERDNQGTGQAVLVKKPTNG